MKLKALRRGNPHESQTTKTQRLQEQLADMQTAAYPATAAQTSPPESEEEEEDDVWPRFLKSCSDTIQSQDVRLLRVHQPL